MATQGLFVAAYPGHQESMWLDRGFVRVPGWSLSYTILGPLLPCLDNAHEHLYVRHGSQSYGQGLVMTWTWGAICTLHMQPP